MQLEKEAAIELMLKTGEIEEVTPAARATALQAVELCGRLPLCLAIAGAMILEHADDWETWLVPALRESHGAELRERSASVGDGANEGSVEERVLRASLRSIKVEERVGVTALFDVCACFACVRRPAGDVDVDGPVGDPSEDGFLMTSGLKNASKCRTCSKTLDIGTAAWCATGRSHASVLCATR